MNAGRRGHEGESETRKRSEAGWGHDLFRLHMIDPFQ